MHNPVKKKHKMKKKKQTIPVLFCHGLTIEPLICVPEQLRDSVNAGLNSMTDDLRVRVHKDTDDDGDNSDTDYSFLVQGLRWVDLLKDHNALVVEKSKMNVEREFANNGVEIFKAFPKQIDTALQLNETSSNSSWFGLACEKVGQIAKLLPFVVLSQSTLFHSDVEHRRRVFLLLSDSIAKLAQDFAESCTEDQNENIPFVCIAYSMGTMITSEFFAEFFYHDQRHWRDADEFWKKCLETLTPLGIQLVKRLRLYITVGSPLMWYSLTPNPRSIPDHINWINFWYQADIIGGKLNGISPLHSHIVDVVLSSSPFSFSPPTSLLKVKDMFTSLSLMKKTGAAHVCYFSDTTFYQTIVESIANLVKYPRTDSVYFIDASADIAEEEDMSSASDLATNVDIKECVVEKMDLVTFVDEEVKVCNKTGDEEDEGIDRDEEDIGTDEDTAFFSEPISMTTTNAVSSTTIVAKQSLDVQKHLFMKSKRSCSMDLLRNVIVMDEINYYGYKPAPFYRRAQSTFPCVFVTDGESDEDDEDDDFRELDDDDDEFFDCQEELPKPPLGPLSHRLRYLTDFNVFSQNLCDETFTRLSLLDDDDEEEEEEKGKGNNTEDVVVVDRTVVFYLHGPTNRSNYLNDELPNVKKHCLEMFPEEERDKVLIVGLDFTDIVERELEFRKAIYKYEAQEEHHEGNDRNGERETNSWMRKIVDILKYPYDAASKLLFTMHGELQRLFAEDLSFVTSFVSDDAAGRSFDTALCASFEHIRHRVSSCLPSRGVQVRLNTIVIGNALSGPLSTIFFGYRHARATPVVEEDKLKTNSDSMNLGPQSTVRFAFQHLITFVSPFAWTVRIDKLEFPQFNRFQTESLEVALTGQYDTKILSNNPCSDTPRHFWKSIFYTTDIFSTSIAPFLTNELRQSCSLQEVWLRPYQFTHDPNDVSKKYSWMQVLHKVGYSFVASLKRGYVKDIHVWHVVKNLILKSEEIVEEDEGVEVNN